MPYYCKKCGAVVTGRFCSCCGTRATSGLEDFRKAQRRMDRKFRDVAHEDKRFTGKESGLAAHVAWVALEVAFNKLLPDHALHVDRFDQYSEQCWKKLPECQELAELLYEQAVGLLLIKK